MGNANGGNGGNRSACTGPKAPGLNQHCFNVGWAHGADRRGDPVGHGVDAAPCTLNANANRCYAQGFMFGRGGGGSGTNGLGGNSNPYGHSYCPSDG